MIESIFANAPNHNSSRSYQVGFVVRSLRVEKLTGHYSDYDYFISIQNVPWGISLIDTNYWLPYQEVRTQPLTMQALNVKFIPTRHDPNAGYDAGNMLFDFVTNHRYIAKQDVPPNKNIQFSDTEYWAIITGESRKVEMNYMVGCGAIIFDPLGNVLVGERNDYAGNPTEALFGGKPESNETLAEGLSREIREELGIHIDPKRFTQIAIVEASPGNGIKCLTAYLTVRIEWDEVKRVQNMEPHKCFGLHWRTNEQVNARGLWQGGEHYVQRAFGCLFSMRRQTDRRS